MVGKNLATDEAVLRELGERLARIRLERNWTQIELADAAGVSKRTVERLEGGKSTQLSSLIRLCRALQLLDRFDAIIPELSPGPMAQLKLRGKDRQRASSKANESAAPAKKWEWGVDQ